MLQQQFTDIHIMKFLEIISIVECGIFIPHIYHEVVKLFINAQLLNINNLGHIAKWFCTENIVNGSCDLITMQDI